MAGESAVAHIVTVCAYELEPRGSAIHSTEKSCLCSVRRSENQVLLGEPVLASFTTCHQTTSQIPSKQDQIVCDAELGTELSETSKPELDGTEKWRPLKLQLYVWSIPSMLLGNSILLSVVGLAVWVFATARAAGWGSDEGKTSVFFGAFFFCCGELFLEFGWD